MKQFWTHPSVFSDVQNIKAVALFYFIKVRYSNSTIYNYNPNKVSKLTGFGYNLSKKLVEVLIRSGYARLHNGNLTMIKVKGRYRSGYKKHTSENFDIEQISTIILVESLKEQERRQKHIIKLKEDINKLQDASHLRKNEIKKLIKFRDGLSKSEILLDNVIVTVRKLATLWNVSHTTAMRILKYLKDKGLIQTKELIEKIGQFSGNVPFSLNLGHSYSYNGYLYHHYGSMITFI